MLLKTLLFASFFYLPFAVFGQAKVFDFHKLRFSSSTCNGTCPSISMNIYADKKIEFSRIIYKSKGRADTSLSHNFKGQLEESEFNYFIKLINQINWDTLTVANLDCCDAPIITIALSYAHEYRLYKSMQMPGSLNTLIRYLTNIAVTARLPIFHGKIYFEE
ncbi:MAG: hypothetical protein JWQ27_46 [Ferruginibacter sp.]|nr:hypothetical protein [Ferruginibacter sp.]